MGIFDKLTKKPGSNDKDMKTNAPSGENENNEKDIPEADEGFTDADLFEIEAGDFQEGDLFQTDSDEFQDIQDIHQVETEESEFQENHTPEKQKMQNQELSSLSNTGEFSKENIDKLIEEASAKLQDTAIMSEFEELSKLAENLENFSENDLEQLLMDIKEPIESNYDYIQNVEVYQDPSESSVIPDEDLAKIVEEVSPKKEKKGFRFGKKKSAGINEDGEGEKEEPKSKRIMLLLNKAAEIPTKFLLLTTAILFLAVSASGVFLYFQLQNKNRLETIYAQNVAKVTPPKYISNNANYIYISQEKPFDGNLLKLNRMLISPVETIFYFDGEVELMKYDILLTDSDDNMYNMDLSFVGASSEIMAETALHFEPLADGVKKLELCFLNSLNKESVKFTIEFEKKFPISDVKYVQEPIVAEISDLTIDLSVESAVFSTTGSRINYVLKWKNDDNKIMHGQTGKNIKSEYVTLLEGGRTVAKLKDKPTEITFPEEKMILGRMDFDSVRNLNGNVEFIFENLFKEYKINRRIPIASLFNYTDPDSQIVVDISQYKLVLEGIKKFDSQYIMVYHVLDSGLIAKSSPEGGDNRVEVQIDATLVAQVNGVEALLRGECYSKLEGGDMVFNTGSMDSFFASCPKDELYLTINSVYFKINDVSIPIALEKTPADKAHTDFSDAEQVILDGFKKRLEIKSGIANIGELQYVFSDDILLNSELMKEYEPIVAPNAKFTANIISSAFENDKIYAYVLESWQNSDGLREVVFYRSHKVICEYTNNGWIITGDVILK